MIKELDTFWKKEFGSFEPLAHELKASFSQRWVRIHTLPESKRYPENESEYCEIFRRHNTVLADLNGEGNELLIVLPEYTENEFPQEPAKELNEIIHESKYWCTLNQMEECGVYWHLHVAQITLGSKELENIFRLVANDEVRNIILILLKNSIVYHPYDGGADIVLQSSEKRDVLKVKYSSWLSTHSSGC